MSRTSRFVVPLVVALVAGEAGAIAQNSGVREVTASSHGLIPLQTRLRYTTMVVLPEGEEILDVICGDRDFWVISVTQNMAHIKPSKENATTNLNLVTASGTAYSFLLTEKSGSGMPDIKVYIAADPQAKPSKPKFFSAAQVESLQGALNEARAAAVAADRRATETVASYQQQYPATLEFAYGTPKYAKPFLVRAIWHDGRFTYIKTDAAELPTLYELKDGKPAIVNFQVHAGTYVVPKVLEEGYLSLGKERLAFAQER